jgi:hypothetical protein
VRCVCITTNFSLFMNSHNTSACSTELERHNASPQEEEARMAVKDALKSQIGLRVARQKMKDLKQGEQAPKKEKHFANPSFSYYRGIAEWEEH